MILTVRSPLLAAACAAALLTACQKAEPDVTSVNVEDTTANASMNDADGNGLPTSQSASLPLSDANGAAKGSVNATEDAGGVTITLTASGLPEGVHGVHLHTTGLCEGPKFESAGSHWNPSDKKHGRDNPAGSHMGDLDNLTIAADGSGKAKFTIAGATLSPGPMSLADDEGTSIVVHARRDDYKTDPSGDSGDRIACAVIAPAKAPKAA